MVLFMVKMSITKWSELEAEEARRDVTFMDREVAGNWLDRYSEPVDFTFANFLRNVPVEDTSLERLERSDCLDTSTVSQSISFDTSTVSRSRSYDNSLLRGSIQGKLNQSEIWSKQLKLKDYQNKINFL